MTGIEVFLDMLASADVTHVFGNPGTTELPLNDALAGDARFRYICGLHEIAVVSMADGYAMASGKLGVANVHIACGLGNAMGMLYNAWCEGTPLLLTAGQQDRRLRLSEPVLEADLVSVARPWAKWAAEVSRAEDMPLAVRRAIQTALTPPTGPVFLSLPLDVQLESVEDPDLSPPWLPDRRIRPPREALNRAVELLAHATHPAILAGSRVTEADACEELAAVAEQLGAPIFAECATSHGRVPLRPDHPLYAGALPLWAPDVHRLLAPFDLLLAVGVNVLRLYIYRGAVRPIPEHVRVIHLDANIREIGKNYPVEVGLPGDPKAGLAELADQLAQRMTQSQRAAARQRGEQHAARRAAEREALLHEIARQQNARGISPSVLMDALARVLPSDAAVVEEAPTTHRNVLERLGALKDPKAGFAHRGWALGWGVGCALGVRLAWPERPVVALLGDGAALYGLQGLWSAAHYDIPVTFIICNNAQYRILKQCAGILNLPNAERTPYPGVDLVRPEIDFVGLARSFGVEAARLDDPEDLTDHLREALRSDRAWLFDVRLTEPDG